MAATALGVSERSVFVALEIAKGIAAPIRARIAAHPIADRQIELIALAHEPEARQTQIVDLLLDPESGVHSVADAIAALDRRPRPSRAEPWEKLSGTFARLKPAQQRAFFEAHLDAITLWLAQRKKA